AHRRLFGVLRQIVANLKPVGLRSDVDVPVRSSRQRSLNRAKAHAHRIGHGIATTDDGRAAMSAEYSMYAVDAVALESILALEHHEILCRDERACRER